MSSFGPGVLELDTRAEISRIAGRLREQVTRLLRRRGAVVALSGGIDSSVVGALAVRALGPEHVLGLLLPERDSAAETPGLGQTLTEHLGIASIQEDITPLLEATGCYRRRDDALREVVPAYGPGWKFKIVLPQVGEDASYNFFSAVVQSPDGAMQKVRLPPRAYLGIVAATNFKQRVRKMLEYYHADRLQYAVAGTPNRLEYDQGFFVKLGDGAADVKPIAHLYKTQVYALARALGLPEEICARPPTTDTYSLSQGQDEFYFSLPYAQLDLCLYAHNHAVAAADVAPHVGLRVDQVERVYADITKKRATTRYLHSVPQLIEAVPEISRV
ncbi:MAG: NAD(+) synthase [Pseudomonadota bacterium]